jgi:hypothetical protein
MNDPRDGLNTGPYGETGGTGHNYRNYLTTLEKIYKDDSKYSGRNDNFDHKLGMFYDLCLKANVPPSARNIVYSTMLRGPALDHYYTNLRHCTQTTSLLEGRLVRSGVIYWSQCVEGSVVVYIVYIGC